jgi:predicted acylesterase/phospholipase RssA
MSQRPEFTGRFGSKLNLVIAMPTKTQRFRILSLDGGGIKGAFTAAALSEWEKVTGKRLTEYFDLIAGTSTGGIIALGLGLGLPAMEILKFYQEKGPEIFPNITAQQKLMLNLRHLWQAKYGPGPLRAALEGVFGDRKLKDSKSRLVIPAYDIVRGRIYVFKTRHHPELIFDEDLPAVDVALATAAAPTFFEHAEISAQSGAIYVDGGTWANCPALVALVEAIHFLNAPLESIDVLSVGTLSEPASFVHHVEKKLFGGQPGLAQWAPNLVGMMFRGQMEAALTATSLLTDRRLMRIDVVVEPGIYSLDGVDQIKHMVSLARGEAVKREVLGRVKELFLNDQPAEKFLPVQIQN